MKVEILVQAHTSGAGNPGRGSDAVEELRVGCA